MVDVATKEPLAERCVALRVKDKMMPHFILNRRRTERFSVHHRYDEKLFRLLENHRRHLERNLVRFCESLNKGRILICKRFVWTNHLSLPMQAARGGKGFNIRFSVCVRCVACLDEHVISFFAVAVIDQRAATP